MTNQAFLAKAKEMWAAKYGIADIMTYLRVEMHATRDEREQAVADMLRGK